MRWRAGDSREGEAIRVRVMARRRPRDGSFPRWPFVVLILALAGTGGAYALMPFVEPILRARLAERPPPEPPPPVRATVNGVALTIPRDLVRFEHQKRDADQARLDLLIRWPSLEGAGLTGRPPSEALRDLIFLSIVPKDDALDPARRFNAVYARFLEQESRPAPIGLAARRFRQGSGYDGEELLFDPVRPGDFAVRCAPETADAPQTCMRELRIAERLDVVIRFSRPLLDDWRRLDRAVLALLAAIGAPAGQR